MTIQEVLKLDEETAVEGWAGNIFYVKGFKGSRYLTNKDGENILDIYCLNAVVEEDYKIVGFSFQDILKINKKTDFAISLKFIENIPRKYKNLTYTINEALKILADNLNQEELIDTLLNNKNFVLNM